MFMITPQNMQQLCSLACSPPLHNNDAPAFLYSASANQSQTCIGCQHLMALLCRKEVYPKTFNKFVTDNSWLFLCPLTSPISRLCRPQCDFVTIDPLRHSILCGPKVTQYLRVQGESMGMRLLFDSTSLQLDNWLHHSSRIRDSRGYHNTFETF